MKQGLLYSQIGYDIGDPMKAYFRSDAQDTLKDAYFEVTFLDTGDVKRGIPAFWGQKWKSYWWILDFAGIDRTCEFIIKLYSDGKEIERSTPIKADYNMIWDTTIKTVAIDAFEERERRARNNGGWKDCGSEFREVCSISPSVTSLCDLLNRCPADFTRKEQERLRKQIMAGADYLFQTFFGIGYKIPSIILSICAFAILLGGIEKVKLIANIIVPIMIAVIVINSIESFVNITKESQKNINCTANRMKQTKGCMCGISAHTLTLLNTSSL